MSITINKFLEYLKEYSKVSSKDLKNKDLKLVYDYVDRQYATKTLIRLFSVEKEDWEEYSELYYDFEGLSRYLIKSPLNTREKFMVILHLIQKNIATGIFQKEIQVFDPRKNKEYEFTSLTKQQVENLWLQKEYTKLQQADNYILTDKQKRIKSELYEYATECKIDASDIILNHSKIQGHYLDKIETYDMDDIDTIVDTLKDMKVNGNLCENIKNMLIKQLEKRTKRNGIGNYTSFRVSPISTVMPKKEYYALKKEVQEYENAMNENYMSVSDSIHLVYLLQQLNYKENEIKDILKKIDKKNKQQNFDKINPIVQYNDLYNKLKFYSDKGYGIEKLKELEGYFQEIFIVNDEEYATYKGWLAETLQTTLEIIPNDYEYELQEAATYIKK